jgi:hypothetical protein
VAGPETYVAPIDGQRCLRTAGRLKRLELPLPPEPPRDVAPAACFLCHPELDAHDLGPWRFCEGGELRVLGNAHPFAERALLLAAAGEALHEKTPASLPRAALEAMLRAPFDPEWRTRAGLDRLALAAFANVGLRAAQSRLHPHMQVAGFDPARLPVKVADAAAIAADLAAAAGEARTVALDGGAPGAVRGVVPRAPGMTAELWIPLPGRDRDSRRWEDVSRAAAAACRACERALSGSMNLVWRLDEPALLRLVPRGLSERAGLELAAPGLLGSVIAASVRETVELWTGAIDAIGSLPPR